MNKIIRLCVYAALFAGLPFLAYGKTIDYGVKNKLVTAPSKAPAKKEAAGRVPAAAKDARSMKPASPLLYDTGTPKWAEPRPGDNYSCEASTAYYGKTCTSRFLSF